MKPGGWEIPVSTSLGPAYPVRVGRGVIEELPLLLERLSPAAMYAVIADDRVFELHGQKVLSLLSGLGVPVISETFPHGERNKNRSQWARLTNLLLAGGLGRDGCILALGGGVTGDLAGFVAATYMRGIPVVQLPSSLVAMVDASVGGKTGVDVEAGKNLVGSFHPPRFVLADTDLTATLPRAERSQGLAEAVKHGAILDADYLKWIADRSVALLAGDPDPTAELVARSVEIKAEVVAEDETEAGRRQILNFGHTLGHALEAASDYELSHGDAVAQGMVLESRLGERLGITRPGTTEALIAVLEAVELPVRVEEAPPADTLIELTSRDKKVRGGSARYVLLKAPGQVDPGTGWSRDVEAAVVRGLLLDERTEAV